jgi:hypothetical protein
MFLLPENMHQGRQVDMYIVIYQTAFQKTAFLILSAWEPQISCNICMLELINITFSSFKMYTTVYVAASVCWKKKHILCL